MYNAHTSSYPTPSCAIGLKSTRTGTWGCAVIDSIYLNGEFKPHLNNGDTIRITYRIHSHPIDGATADIVTRQLTPAIEHYVSLWAASHDATSALGSVPVLRERLSYLICRTAYVVGADVTAFPPPTPAPLLKYSYSEYVSFEFYGKALGTLSTGEAIAVEYHVKVHSTLLVEAQVKELVAPRLAYLTRKWASGFHARNMPADPAALWAAAKETCLISGGHIVEIGGHALIVRHDYTREPAGPARRFSLGEDGKVSLGRDEQETDRMQKLDGTELE